MSVRSSAVVLHGASGFVDKQTVQYFARHANTQVRWAIAKEGKEKELWRCSLLEHRRGKGKEVSFCRTRWVLVAEVRDAEAGFGAVESIAIARCSSSTTKIEGEATMSLFNALCWKKLL